MLVFIVFFIQFFWGILIELFFEVVFQFLEQVIHSINILVLLNFDVVLEVLFELINDLNHFIIFLWHIDFLFVNFYDVIQLINFIFILFNQLRCLQF